MMRRLQRSVLFAVSERGYANTYRNSPYFTRGELLDRFSRPWRSRHAVERVVRDLLERGCLMRFEDGYQMKTYRWELIDENDHLVLTSTGDVSLNRGWLPSRWLTITNVAADSPRSDCHAD